MAATPQSARRRSSTEIRGLILDSARELFTAQGYDETTTKQIAAEAGVLEHLLFRNFGSKAAIFDAAVVGPLSELIDDYIGAWDKTSAGTTSDERIAAFIEGLYDFARTNRTLLLAALSRSRSETDQGEDFLDHLAGTLHAAEGIEAIGDYPDLDPPATLATVAGMVFGVALLDDMIFPRNSRRPSASRLVAEMSKTIVARTQSAGTPTGTTNRTSR